MIAILITTVFAAKTLSGQAFPTTLANNSSTWQFVNQTIADDFDSDGLLDLFVHSTLGFGLSRLHYVADFSTVPLIGLTNATAISEGISPPIDWFIRGGDFNGDGFRDVLTGTTGFPGMYYLRAGNGAGSFSAPTLWGSFNEQANYGYSLDFNGDGIDDVADGLQLTGVNVNTVRVSISSPVGFSSTIFTTLQVTRFIVGDFNADGFDDICGSLFDALGNGYGGSMFLWLGRLPGQVAPPTFLGSAAIPVEATSSADFDNDGDDDVALVSNSGVISILSGNPVAPLSIATTIGVFPSSTGLGGFRVRAADLDSDAFVDLIVEEGVTSGLLNSNLTMLRNDGTGHFSIGSRRTVWSSSSFTGMYIANDDIQGPTFRDFDGDGDIDILDGQGPVVTSPGIFLARNSARYGVGCAGSPGVPVARVGSAYPGNPGFAVSVENALPNSLAVLLVSLAPAAQTPCGLLVDTGTANLIAPNVVSSFRPVAANGTAQISLAVPAALAGLQVYAQWALPDPNGAVMIQGISLAFSEGRTITIF